MRFTSTGDKPWFPEVGMHLAAEMRPHVVPDTSVPLMSEPGDIDWRNDDFLTGTRIRLGEDSAIVIDKHASTGPAERRIVLHGRTLVYRENKGRIFQRPRSVDQRPPVGRRRRAPRVHVGRDTNEYFRTLECKFSNRLRE